MVQASLINYRRKKARFRQPRPPRLGSISRRTIAFYSIVTEALAATNRIKTIIVNRRSLKTNIFLTVSVDYLAPMASVNNEKCGRHSDNSASVENASFSISV